MLRLFLLRVIPLLLRPVAVILEGVFIETEQVLVLVLPISMMVLTISSIPVHLDYFKSLASQPNRDQLSRKYMSALTWLTLGGILMILPISMVPSLGLHTSIIYAICIVFVIEKLADEASRTLEFRKAFGKWFLVQAFRSGWFFLPIGASLFGFDYVDAFLIAGLIALSIMYFVFKRVLGLIPRLSLEGISSIRNNIVFLVGSFLPASYRQLPRIAIAKIYPDQAYVFLAISQLTQSVGLVFNVRFQIPYRKVMARRTAAFQKILQPVMLKLLLPAALIAVAYFLLSVAVDPAKLSSIELALLLGPILTADALTFAILSAHLGYLPWYANNRAALATYLLCITAAIVFAGLLVSVEVSDYITILGVPALTMVVAFIWLILIIRLNFSGRKIMVGLHNIQK
jgi:hypothetical protein